MFLVFFICAVWTLGDSEFTPSPHFDSNPFLDYFFKVNLTFFTCKVLGPLSIYPKKKNLTKAAAIGLTFLNPIKELKDYTKPRRLFPSTDILL